MIRQLISVSLLSILSLFALAGCASSSNKSTTPVESQEDDAFLSRPRFEKPTARPLGRVLLSWNAIKDADGYEIEMSLDKDFLSPDKSWTVRGLNLEIPVPEKTQVFFRIRAFNVDQISRWSTVSVEETFE